MANPVQEVEEKVESKVLDEVRRTREEEEKKR